MDDRDGATDIDAAGQLAINVLDERGTSPFGGGTWRDVRLESVIRTIVLQKSFCLTDHKFSGL